MSVIYKRGHVLLKKRVETIDEYIKDFPGNVQRILESVRQTIRKAAPEAVDIYREGAATKQTQ